MGLLLGLTVEVPATVGDPVALLQNNRGSSLGASNMGTWNLTVLDCTVHGEKRKEMRVQVYDGPEDEAAADEGSDRRSQKRQCSVKTQKGKQESGGLEDGCGGGDIRGCGSKIYDAQSLRYLQTR